MIGDDELMLMLIMMMMVILNVMIRNGDVDCDGDIDRDGDGINFLCSIRSELNKGSCGFRGGGYGGIPFDNEKVCLCVIMCAVMHYAYPYTHTHTTQCQQYFDGRINGTYCGRLCSPVHGTTSVRCPSSHNGEKDKVFFVNQNGYDVVLKANSKFLHHAVKKALERLRDAQIHSLLINFNVILEKAISAVLFHGQKNIPPNILQDIARECDYDVNGVVSTQEALSCLEVVTSKEYLMYKVLYPSPGIPNVFGTCGRLYAVEALDVGAMEDYLTVDRRPWSQRAQMALSFLDVIESLENTPYGVAYLCDVREDNFAVKDGTSVFIIDLDTVLFQEEASYELDKQFHISDKCSNNADCNDLVSCVTECNKTSGVCQESLLSNNLEVDCVCSCASKPF